MSKTENKCQLQSFYEDDRSMASGNVHFNACELCDNIILDPSLNDMSRLLRATIKLVNVCPGKEVTVGCIVTDRCGKILAYKSDTFIASQSRPQITEDTNLVTDNKILPDCGCPSSCIDVVRTFNFILPSSDVCSQLDVKVKVMANYTSPCS